jgi:membrane protease YdiL (CAAX protease family)
MMKKRIISLFLFVIIIIIGLPTLAFGYIDPGTGSYLLQVAIAALLGGVLAVKIFWQKIKKFFINLFSRKQKQQVDGN